MRVAYDAAPTLDRPTGVGRYVRELGIALELQGVSLTRYAVALRGRSDVSIRRWRVPARVAQFAWRRLHEPSLDRLVGAVDVVHATNFVLPALRRSPGVVTVHDLSFLRADAFPGSERLRELVPWSVKRAARVLVPTEAIATEVAERLRVPRPRVAVTYEGVAPLFFGATPLPDTVLGKMGIPGPFAVAAGTIEPRKNLARLVSAWERARADLDGWTLVVAGPKGWGEALPRRPGVVVLGWLGDETLPGLLAAAEFFCYPSVYEGFGLPPLEAMAAGTPAIVGSYPAAAEVVADAALVVDGTDVDALADGIRRLATDDALRRKLALKGRARAISFTWERTAAATIAAYRAALGS